MTTQRNWTRNAVIVRPGLALCIGAALLLGGCKKPPPEPPPPPPPPPPIVVPEPLDVASLLQSMDVDARVEFAESEAPVDRGLAEAAIHLANAFARGDDEALRSMLDKGNQQMLDQLIASEQWWEQTERIEAVRVVSIDGGSRLSESPESTQLAFAVQDLDGAYLMAWSGRKVFDDWVFSAAPSSGEERARASEWDGLAAASVGGGGFEALFAGNDELRELMTKVMASPASLTLDDLLKVKEMLSALDPVPTGLLEMVDLEIAKRQDRGGGDGGDAGGGGNRGGGGSSPGRDRDPPSDPGPGGPG